jgi:D-aminoacyl-tRNA deacylase
LIGLIQRALEAKVVVAGTVVAHMNSGLLVFLCAERTDDTAKMRSLVDKVLTYRVFSDAAGKMNLSLSDVGGGLMLVPQFTLAADTHSGTRPSFTPAAPPAQAKVLFDQAAEYARERCSDANTVDIIISTGVFGADMKVHLINDGPVTFWLKT